VSGSNGYLLKLALEGQPSASLVRRLQITTWVQVAPASLPALRAGNNRMEFRTGDQYGLPSRVTEIRTNGNDRADFFKYLHQQPTDFDPARTTARAKGTLVVKLQAPPRARIAWFSAGANFHTHQRNAASQTRNAMAYALERPQEFQDFYQAEIPADQSHWHYNADRIVKPDTLARTVYIRYTGDPGVNNLRIYAHSVDDKPSAESPVVITHVWTENGESKSKSVTLDRAGTYEVATQQEPINESIELSIPGGPRT
jgi:hypothetical protein